MLTSVQHIFDNINAYPALYRQPSSKLILVGGVNVNGRRTPCSQGGPLSDISAPSLLIEGIGVEYASGRDEGGARLRGTSLAAPAYVISPNLILTERHGSVSVAVSDKSWITAEEYMWVRVCDFGLSSTCLAILLRTGVADTARLCVYASLDPSSAFVPIQKSAISTEIAALGGLDACVGVNCGPAHLDCP